MWFKVWWYRYRVKGVTTCMGAFFFDVLTLLLYLSIFTPTTHVIIAISTSIGY